MFKKIKETIATLRTYVGGPVELWQRERIADLERKLAEAREVIKPFADAYSYVSTPLLPWHRCAAQWMKDNREKGNE